MIACPLAVEIGSGAVGTLAALLSDRRISSGGQVAVVVGPGQGEEIVGVIRPVLEKADAFNVEGGTVQAALDLADRLRTGSYDAVVGIGGGRTLDVAKYAAGLTGLPMVSVATNLAHDGIASPVASLEHDGHKGSYGVHGPLAVVVDLDYVRRCPPEQLRSGVGDALSNLSALADWELAGRERGEPVDGLAASFARAGAESLLHRTDELLSDGIPHRTRRGARAQRPGDGRGGQQPPVQRRLPRDLPCDRRSLSRQGSARRAGGRWLALRLVPPGGGWLDTLDAAFRRYGVARLPGDLGLTEEEFGAAVALAPSTRPDRYTVLEHLELDDAEIADRVREFVSAFDR